MRKREDHHPVPATNLGPSPADFPLGSVESRAAVRAMINRRAAQDEKAPTIYRASWVGHPQDEDFEILDINTGLPIGADTTDNGTRSASRVHRDEELRGVATKAALAPTTEAEVVRHKHVEDFEILDLP